MAELEHVNITVSDAKKTAQMLCDLFDWKIRWEGSAMNGIGYTVHVGSAETYMALYTPNDGSGCNLQSGRFAHVGVTVTDLDALEAKVKAMGFETHNHGDYEPGKRFYFNDKDDIEFEVVSYS
ncbi:MAG: VOC family protein [Hyphomicrobiales bacterium]